MPSSLRLAWLLLLGGAPLCAGAQEIKAEPSPAVRCLSPAPDQRGAPEYPFDPWKQGQAGRVKVELAFTGAALRPAVKVLEYDGDDSFIEAVKEHVREYRVPCLHSDDIPVRLVIEFVFKPDGRKALWDTPRDEADAARSAMTQCVVHRSGKSAPPYPPAALQGGLQGRVLLKMRFDATDKAPSFEVYGADLHSILNDTIESWAAGYRMPCHHGAPVSTKIVFEYLIEGMGSYGFKPIGFLQFLGRVKGIDQASLAVDTNTMGCPFDLSLLYLQPRLPNVVGQLESTHPARRPLLQWLAGVELDLPRASLAAVYADTARFSVPCLKIKLKPQEKP